MTTGEIRTSFEKYVGNDKYNHFILTLYEAFPLRNRLFFWQEQLLKEFTNEYDLELIELRQAHKIFNHCPVHNYELKNDNVPIVDGNSISSNFSNEKEKEFFPMANVNAPRDLERFSYPKNVDVIYCDKCREFLKQ